jgi:F-type H+-transporting ATPase subunit b
VKATTDRLAAEAAERQKQAAAKLAAMTAEAEKRVADAKAAALGNVRSVASEVARAAAHRLIGGDIDEAQAATAVDAVLQERG